MKSIDIDQFQNDLERFVDEAIKEAQPLKVTQPDGKDFVVISAEEWAREQESLYVLQNASLMRQIAKSMKTCAQGTGYTVTAL